MPNQSRSLRIHSLKTLVTEAEWKKISELFAASSCQYYTEYFRLKLLDKAVTMNYRNKSLDDFLSQLILLRTELIDLGEYFRLYTKELPDFSGDDRTAAHLKMKEHYIDEFFKKLHEIKQCINQFSDQCLQKLIL